MAGCREVLIGQDCSTRVVDDSKRPGSLGRIGRRHTTGSECAVKPGHAAELSRRVADTQELDVGTQYLLFARPYSDLHPGQYWIIGLSGEDAVRVMKQLESAAES